MGGWKVPGVIYRLPKTAHEMKTVVTRVKSFAFCAGICSTIAKPTAAIGLTVTFDA